MTNALCMAVMAALLTAYAAAATSAARHPASDSAKPAASHPLNRAQDLSAHEKINPDTYGVIRFGTAFSGPVISRGCAAQSPR